MLDNTLSELGDLEEATSETLKRHLDLGEENPVDNVKYAIANAIVNGDYNGFTRRNNAREKAKNIDSNTMIYALLRNMVQLSDYEHKKSGDISKEDKIWISNCMEFIKDGRVNNLEDQILFGLRLIVQDHNFSANERIPVAQNQLKTMTNKILECYVVYNSSKHYVKAEDAVTNMIDKMKLEKLDQYYSEAGTSVIKRQ